MPGDPQVVSGVHAQPTLLYRLILRASQPVVQRAYRLDVRGLEHVPERGGFVVAANHTSNVDPWPLSVALWPRSLHFMAKYEAWKPPLKWIIAGVGSFPVRRGEGDVEALENAMRVCREGRVMAMFPEGTRRAKGMHKKREPRPHTGAARIALGAGVPLVPAALRGLDRLSRLGPMRLQFGTPIRLDDLRELDSHAAAEETTRRLWAEIRRLEAELDSEERRPNTGPSPLA
jgi:1-acyl-sn-glycerol-3-phosphate acyltransferase